MRTFEEIKHRLLTDKTPDMLGVRQQVLSLALPWEEIQPTGLLKEGVTEDDWKHLHDSEEAILQEAKDYMEFAMGKADNHRGLSASRSVERYEAWVWLLCPAEQYSELVGLVDTQYAQYGAPVLKAAATMLGFPEQWEQHLTPELERMAAGQPCEPGCDSGCGL